MDAATTERLAHWCLDRSIHFIADEIYALSVFGEGAPFVSAYTLLHSHGEMRIHNHTRLGQPPIPSVLPCAEQRDLVHFLWGASKDFGLNGFRIGVLHSWNKAVLAALSSTAYFFTTPAGLS